MGAAKRRNHVHHRRRVDRRAAGALPEVSFCSWLHLRALCAQRRVKGAFPSKFSQIKSNATRFVCAAVVRACRTNFASGSTRRRRRCRRRRRLFRFPPHLVPTNRCSDPRYQGLTYLGADNAIPAPGLPPGLSKPAAGPTAAFDFLAAAAAAAGAPPPPCPSLPTPTDAPPRSGVRSDADSRSDNTAAAGTGAAAAAAASAGGGGVVTEIVDGGAVIRGLEELDERAAAGACTPAVAAQALARVACRLYGLADDLGGGWVGWAGLNKPPEESRIAREKQTIFGRLIVDSFSVICCLHLMGVGTDRNDPRCNLQCRPSLLQTQSCFFRRHPLKWTRRAWLVCFRFRIAPFVGATATRKPFSRCKSTNRTTNAKPPQRHLTHLSNAQT